MIHTKGQLILICGCILRQLKPIRLLDKMEDSSCMAPETLRSPSSGISSPDAPKFLVTHLVRWNSYGALAHYRSDSGGGMHDVTST